MEDFQNQPPNPWDNFQRLSSSPNEDFQRTFLSLLKEIKQTFDCSDPIDISATSGMTFKTNIQPNENISKAYLYHPLSTSRGLNVAYWKHLTKIWLYWANLRPFKLWDDFQNQSSTHWEYSQSLLLAYCAGGKSQNTFWEHDLLSPKLSATACGFCDKWMLITLVKINSKINK